MKSKQSILGACALLPLFSFGCDDASGIAAPGRWEGAERHLVAVGSIDGNDVAFEIRGAEAQDLETLFCERNYVVPDVEDASTWTEGFLEKIELKWTAEVDGTEREYQIELMAHDFGAAANGATIQVVAYDEESEARSTTTLMSSIEWEYEEAGNEVEVGAQSETGSFVRGELTGAVGADGVVVPDGTGTLGGYLHLSWANGDALDVSFTAGCGDNDLDIP